MSERTGPYISVNSTTLIMRITGYLAVVLGASSIVSTSGAQPTDPPRRAHHSIAYDESRKAVILTGGSTPLDGGQRYEFFNDLWEFNGVRWSPIPASGDKVSGVSLAYDTKRSRMVSFGGFIGRSVIGAVRLLENNVWRTTGDHPAMPAAEAGFVYDASRDRYIAFGGSGGRGRTHADTWEFDGASWRKLDVASPGARQAHSMVYDPERKRTVVFGGMGPSQPGQPPPALGDTWEFDGKVWKRIDVAGPSPRNGAGVTYDSRRKLVILFGGVDSAGFKGDTWSWDGKIWKQLATSGPEPRVMGYIAYDKARDRIVLFGGRKGFPDGDLADTWEWDGMTWRQFNPRG